VWGYEWAGSTSSSFCYALNLGSCFFVLPIPCRLADETRPWVSL
jgi:hypothetical protein